MSATNGNGKHPRRRPRTTSHVPRDGATAREPDGSPSSPGDASTGRTGPQIDPAVTSVSPAVTSVSNGRAPDGRFGEKNRFGKGNPNARRIHELRQMFLEAIEPGAVVALAKRLQVLALQGDMDAMKMLLDQAIGRAPQAVQVAGADGGPLGVNFTAIQAVILDAIGADPAKRLEVAARLMELDDAGDAHAQP